MDIAGQCSQILHAIGKEDRAAGFIWEKVNLKRFGLVEWNKRQQMQSIMTSDILVNTLIKKFEPRIRLRFGVNIPEMFLVPIFYRDYPGYYITEHTDVSSKIATMQFYLPKDETQIHLGTSFHLKKPTGFQLMKTNRFQPNSAYAFARTDSSWHSVKQLAPHEKIRDSLALTVYVKGQEYQSKTYL